MSRNYPNIGYLAVPNSDKNRLKEARKLGFSGVIAPAQSKIGSDGNGAIKQMPDLTSFVGEIFGAG